MMPSPLVLRTQQPTIYNPHLWGFPSYRGFGTNAVSPGILKNHMPAKNNNKKKDGDEDTVDPEAIVDALADDVDPKAVEEEDADEWINGDVKDPDEDF